MGTTSKIVSADMHILEPPDLWEKRIDAEFAERGPRLVSGDEGDWWHVDGERLISVAAGAFAGIKYRPESEDWRFRTYQARWEDVRPGAYVPVEFAKDLDIDGISAGVVYPTIGLRHFYLVRDNALFAAICRAYNDWAGEFCGEFPDRILAVAMIDVADPKAAAEELRRASKLGLRTAMITVYPPEEQPYGHAAYEPLWEAAQELAMPLSLHLATERPPASLDQLRTWGADVHVARVHWTERSLGQMIFAGVFERYPGLKVAVVEQDVAWASIFVYNMDRVYKHKQWSPTWRIFKNGALPSDFFHSNIAVTFQDDRLGVELRSLIGVENMMWGSDYPHPDGTFPHTKEVLDRLFKDVPEEEKAKIMGGNAARFYNLP